MSAHTPGTWGVELDLADDGDIDIVANADQPTSEWVSVALVHCREEADDTSAPPREQALANARLLAAAPDMLKSLRLAAATFESARTALLQIGALSEAESTQKAMSAMAAGCDVAARSTRDFIARVEAGR